MAGAKQRLVACCGVRKLSACRAALQPPAMHPSPPTHLPTPPPPAGLGIQLLLSPDSLDRQGSAKRKGPALPRLSVTDSVLDTRRAFAEAERLGQAEASKELARRARDASSGSDSDASK